MWIYNDSGGGFLRPEIVALPNIGVCALIGLAGALKLASALMGIIFFNRIYINNIAAINFALDKGL